MGKHPLFAINQHTPRKRFSQNFLQDHAMIERIAQVISPQMGQRLLEIGPGFGALTVKILPKVGTLDAVELDRDIAPKLTATCESLGKLTLHLTDILKFDFSILNAPTHTLRIFGNLPYQISTPLLFHCVNYRSFIQDMHFMLQKEVVERLAAKPNTKSYGRLSVMIQTYFDVTPLFIVPNTAFYPKPKVTSQIVRLIPKTNAPCLKDPIRFTYLVKQAFNHRRKMLRNSLCDDLDIDKLLTLNINPEFRPEQLTVTDFIRISEA